MVIENSHKLIKYEDSDSDDLDEKSGRHGYGTDRKKRRGIIEKRRRDRINNSLTDLKRLVPAAYEKQGSAKLEKAEILQMTVDHLKSIQQKGYGGGYHDSAGIAMEYRSIGFRECIAEVARYLVTVEGLDVHDPLRVRLLSHLQYSGHQRDAEAAAKSSSRSLPFASTGPLPSTVVPPSTNTGYPSSQTTQQQSPWNSSSMMPGGCPPVYAMSPYNSSTSPLTTQEQGSTSPLFPQHQSQQTQHPTNQQPQHPPSYTLMLAETTGSSHLMPPSISSLETKSSLFSPTTSVPSNSSFRNLSTSESAATAAFNSFSASIGYPGSTGAYPGYGPGSMGAHHSIFGPSSGGPMPSGMKPYRPWGTELGAY